MTENEIWVAAPPEAVWAVLASPARYSDWVVGTADSYAAAGAWPEPGAELRYDVGVGPFKVGDRTRVLESEPRRRLLLRAELGPLGAIGIGIELEPSGDGTRVTMRERAVEGVANATEPVADTVNAARVAWSLSRLKELAEA